MAWNEPGGGKDPWSGKGGDQGPPDLDEVVKKLQERLGGLFGGRGRGGGGGAGGGAGGPLAGVGLGVIVGIILVVWLASGFYIVQPAERGVVLRFGAYTDTTEPGPHWHLPFPIESVDKVDVDRIESFRHKAQMLTQDENIVDVELTVQSRILDPLHYLFQDQDPQRSLRDATESAVREAIGKNKLDFILTEGRGKIAAEIQAGIQDLLSKYRTGLVATSVNMQPAKAPDAVKAAFDDAIKAREDKERSENKAQAYFNDILPKARGAAARRVAAAEGYRDQVIAEAEGEAARFLAVLAQFTKAPEVTRQRIYLDAVESVMAGTNKVFLDVKDGTNLTLLPLDQLLHAPRPSAAKAPGGLDPGAPSPPRDSGPRAEPQPSRPGRDFVRERGAR